MFERFKRDSGDPDRTTTASTREVRTPGNGRTAVAERPGATRTREQTSAAAAPEPRRERAPTREDMHAARDRQREEFGGINWGAAFFGWLVAVGLGALLVGLLAAAGTAVGLTELSESEATGNATEIAIGGAILGSEYNVLEQLNLPAVPVGDSELATGGALALAIVVVGTLIAAVAGGKSGERY